MKTTNLPFIPLTTELEPSVINAVRTFLILEKLPDDDAHVAALLSYPANTIMNAIASHDSSALLVPVIHRDKKLKLEIQLLQVFDKALEEISSKDLTISEASALKLKKVLMRYS